MTVSPLSNSTITNANGVNRNPSKSEVNASIITHHEESRRLSVSNASGSTSVKGFGLNAAQDPLKLVYQAAIDDLNERLAPYLGESALQKGLGAGVDVSPEATANRIVSITTALFPLFLESNPDLEAQEGKEDFVSIIRSGVLQGFAEAREILQGLQVLDGDIATNIDKTFDLVQKGLDDFLNPPE